MSIHGPDRGKGFQALFTQTGWRLADDHWLQEKNEYSLTSCKWFMAAAVNLTARASIMQA